MSLNDFLLGALIYLAAAVISAPIAKRLGLGSVLGFWWVQWQSAPADTGAQMSRASHEKHEDHD